MRKIITSFIFIVAILVGFGVGFGVVKGAEYAFAVASGYVNEFQAQVSFVAPGQGGPDAEPIAVDQDTIDMILDSRVFYISDPTKKPKTSAISYLVADLKTGQVLVAKNQNQQLPIASITKLMTALVADEVLGLDTQTIIDSFAVNTYGGQGNLKVKEKYTVSELLYPLLLESSNDAAEALARAHDRPSFISDMNAKAQSIGLLKTHFEDASGLSSGNKSTVTDLFKLTQYISTYRKYIFDITKVKKIDLRNKTWLSNSRFRSDDEYAGGKNGYTDEALKTQLALFEHDFDGEVRTVAYVLLRSNDVEYDMKLLRSFVEKNTEYK